MWLFTFFSYVAGRVQFYHLATLLGRADVEQLLEEVVAEGVHHELGELVADLVVDHVHHLLGMLVQTLLQRATAVVVARHLADVAAVALDVAVLPGGGLERLLALEGGLAVEAHRHLQTAAAGGRDRGERALQSRLVAASERERGRGRGEETRLRVHAARREVRLGVGRGDGRELRARRVARVREEVVHVEGASGREGAGARLRTQRVGVWG